MVVFTNGVSNKGEYREFKTKLNHNDDFYNMHETLARRLTLQGLALKERNGEKVGKVGKGHRWKWQLPDLVLIDGGKGQLEAAIRARDEAALQNPTLSKIPFIGLAKREEQIVIHKTKSGVTLQPAALQRLGGYLAESDDFMLVNLPARTNLVKLLQRIRDESHRFAVSYHSTLKRRRQTVSLLDEIPRIGPATRKKLLRTFGSMRGVMQARDYELAKTVGEKKASILRQYLRAEKNAERWP